MLSNVAHELNDADERILDTLAGGRNLPQNIARELDYSRQYVQNRLQMLKAADYVENVGGGLYELVDDPREDTDADTDPEVEALRERVRELNAQLEAARQGDTDVPTDELEDLRTFHARALDALPEDVPGRAAVEDANAVLEEALDNV
jgi:DNA-binding transcriptional MocR family regulator